MNQNPELYDSPGGWPLNDITESDNIVKLVPEHISTIPREFHYFCRDKDNIPRVTVCFLVQQTKSGYIFHKGFSVCSFKNTPFVAYGIALAVARADDAMNLREEATTTKKRRLLPAMREEITETLIACGCNNLVGMRKGVYNVKGFTEYEEKLLSPFLPSKVGG